MLTTEGWIHAAFTLVGLIAAVGVNAFLMGRKFEAVSGKIENLQTKINGKFEKQQLEDEHCKGDRFRISENLGKLFGTQELHGQEIAVLRGEAKTWRKGDAHG